MLRVALLMLALLAPSAALAQTYLLNETFNSGSTGWTIANTGTSTQIWQLSTTGPTWSAGTLNGTQMMLVDADAGGGTATVTTTLTSPVFNGTTASGSLFLAFAQYFYDYINEVGTVEVYNGTSWIQVYQVTTATGAWNNPNLQNLDITAYKNANNQVRFTYNDFGNYGYHWAVDNIQVYYNSGPEIDVQRPAGVANSIPNNGRCDVGQAPAGSVTNFQWTIANQGGSSLTHTAAIAGSPAPVNCTLGTITLPASTAASATSVMTVPVTPTAAGFFTFRITITNNDSNENPYNIDVSGIALGGSVLFYGGDWDTVDGTVNGRGFALPNDVFVYEDFTVPAGQTWTVTQLFSNNLLNTPSAINQADWEIRTGVAAGTGGTLVSSGTGLNVSIYPTGQSGFGYTEYTVITHLTTPVVLTAGTYFVGIRPVRTGMAGNCFCSTTAGTNGVGTPLGNDLAFGNQTGTQFTGLNWEQLSDGGTPPIYYDYSIGVRGTSSGTSTPTLTVNPTGTITVPATTAGTAGTAASFTVSGSNLTPASGNVTLALTSTPAGIQFRNATAAGTFGTGNIVIAYTGGAFAAQTIEVRFASTATAGSYTGSIAITGGGATAVNVPLSGTVNAAGGTLNITTGTLPNGVVGTPYNATITSTGGTGTHSWTVSAGSLPPGLSLTGGTAATTSISGTPTTAGTFNFTIQVTAGAQTDTQAYSVTVTTSGGGTGTIGGGGGGGGCSVEGGVSPWYLLAGLASLAVLALRRRRQAA